eukprot:3427508-Pyramimonas_sp.AAC.1
MACGRAQRRLFSWPAFVWLVVWMMRVPERRAHWDSWSHGVLSDAAPRPFAFQCPCILTEPPSPPDNRRISSRCASAPGRSP